MTEDSRYNDLTSVDTRELLARVSMFGPGETPQRSNPLMDPPAFNELTSRLADLIAAPYDIIVVRDLVGDKILGYQLSLITGKPVFVSFDREGVITLDRGGTLPQDSQALIVADVHFTPYSIRAAAAGLDKIGLDVSGVGLLLQIGEEDHPFPVWALAGYENDQDEAGEQP